MTWIFVDIQFLASLTLLANHIQNFKKFINYVNLKENLDYLGLEIENIVKCKEFMETFSIVLIKSSSFWLLLKIVTLSCFFILLFKFDVIHKYIYRLGNFVLYFIYPHHPCFVILCKVHLFILVHFRHILILVRRLLSCLVL